MKQRRLALAGLLAAVLILLMACGKSSASSIADTMNDQPAMLAPYAGLADTAPAPEAPPTEAPEYQFTDRSLHEDYLHEDGTLLAYVDYGWQALEVANLDALSEADRELAERNAETFNARLEELFSTAKSNGEVASYAREVYDYEKEQTVGLPYCEEASSETTLCGSVVSVRQSFYYNTGGAHPNSTTGSLTFDLTAAQFIAPVQIADDPGGFHAGAAELLIQKADSMGEEYTAGYWPDYRDVIQLWDTSAAVLFDADGMTVIFSPYALGPYAMGSVELRLSREELSDLIGPGGMEKLGWAVEAVALEEEE